MPQAIKSYAVNIANIQTSTSATVYTCPASTTAKLIISHIYGVVMSAGACSLTIGNVVFGPMTTTALTFNNGLATGALSPSAPFEMHITAGQTVSYVITASSGNGATLRLQMCVIEEAS